MSALKQAEIIPISKGRDKMAKFEKGYVMSSRLYRSDVRPFLTDAAKNVYAELEDRINGFKDKTTDFVSYSQLQGGKLPGSKKLGTATVRRGLKELIDLGELPEDTSIVFFVLKRKLPALFILIVRVKE